MNHSLRNLIMILLLLGLPLGLHASTGVTVLKDGDLAKIRGGFCFLETCEDPPGTGFCQLIPATEAAVCTFTLCIYDEETIGSVISYSCGFLGLSSCTESATYRQCVLAFTESSCNYGTSTACGVNFVPGCHIDKPDRKCVCYGEETDTPCDWTDCISGS